MWSSRSSASGRARPRPGQTLPPTAGFYSPLTKAGGFPIALRPAARFLTFPTGASCHELPQLGSQSTNRWYGRTVWTQAGQPLKAAPAQAAPARFHRRQRMIGLRSLPGHVPDAPTRSWPDAPGTTVPMGRRARIRCWRPSKADRTTREDPCPDVTFIQDTAGRVAFSNPQSVKANPRSMPRDVR